MGSGGGLEAVLAAHEYALGYKRGAICMCGFVPEVDPGSLQAQQDYHRAHVAAALAAHLGAVAGDVVVRESASRAISPDAEHPEDREVARDAADVAVAAFIEAVTQ